MRPGSLVGSTRASTEAGVATQSVAQAAPPESRAPRVGSGWPNSEFSGEVLGARLRSVPTLALQLVRSGCCRPCFPDTLPEPSGCELVRVTANVSRLPRLGCLSGLIGIDAIAAGSNVSTLLSTALSSGSGAALGGDGPC